MQRALELSVFVFDGVCKRMHLSLICVSTYFPANMVVLLRFLCYLLAILNQPIGCL